MRTFIYKYTKSVVVVVVGGDRRTKSKQFLPTTGTTSITATTAVYNNNKDILCYKSMQSMTDRLKHSIYRVVHQVNQVDPIMFPLS